MKGKMTVKADSQISMMSTCCDAENGGGNIRQSEYRSSTRFYCFQIGAWTGRLKIRFVWVPSTVSLSIVQKK